jgi:mono/diheme cytochrome c family protein
MRSLHPVRVLAVILAAWLAYAPSSSKGQAPDPKDLPAAEKRPEPAKAAKGPDGPGAKGPAEKLPPPLEKQPPGESPQLLAQEVQRIFATSCYRCHGETQVVPGFAILDKKTWKENYVRGRPEDSEFWKRLSSSDPGYRMPPDGAGPRPQELDTVRQWIAKSAPDFSTGGFGPRKPVFEVDVLNRILEDLARTPLADRANIRYISLAHLHNNPAISNESLSLYRAALAKLLNSLSSADVLYLPEPIDDLGEPIPRDRFDRPIKVRPAFATVYRIDLTFFQWGKPKDSEAATKPFKSSWYEPRKSDTTSPASLWDALVRRYPYGFKRGPAAKLVDAVFAAGGGADGFPYIRLDWFVAAASSPKNYYLLTKMPRKFDEFQERLGMNYAEALATTLAAKEGSPKLPVRRAAFSGSGITIHNRVVDRVALSAKDRAVITFDFNSSSGAANVYRFPLGPKHADIARPFDHAGGEVIYRLRNGLHGYLLFNKQNDVLEDGPQEVVFDRNAFSGSPTVKNGVSCMGCHRAGFITPVIDVVRRSVFEKVGREFDQVSTLYEDVRVMNDLIEQDNKEYLAVLGEVCQPYALPGMPPGWYLARDPVTTLVSWYLRPLDISDVASELFTNLEGRDIVKNAALLRLGLGPLVPYELPGPPGAGRREIRGTIHRAAWEDWDGAQRQSSIFQLTGQELGLGQSLYPTE